MHTSTSVGMRIRTIVFVLLVASTHYGFAAKEFTQEDLDAPKRLSQLLEADKYEVARVVVEGLVSQHEKILGPTTLTLRTGLNCSPRCTAKRTGPTPPSAVRASAARL